MEYTDYQKELIRELERLSVNTRYPGNFTLSINTFLLELIAARKKVEVNCECKQCQNFYSYL